MHSPTAISQHLVLKFFLKFLLHSIFLRYAYNLACNLYRKCKVKKLKPGEENLELGTFVFYTPLVFSPRE